MKSKNSSKSGHRKSLKWLLLATILVFVVARLTLPFFVLRYVNKTLSEMKGFNGHVEDIDIRLIRGAYIIKMINIYETDNELKKSDSIPFFSSAKIDLSVDWKSLFHKRLVGEIKMDNPVLNFKNKKTDNSDIKSDTADFRFLIHQLIPLTINSLKIVNGEVHYIDRYSSPIVDIKMDRIKGYATNLSNVINKDTLLPAKISGTGNTYGGSFTVNVNLDLLNEYPTFDLNAEMIELDLTQVNNFLRAYANFDVAKGVFSVYSEFAANNGKFKGYVKPLLSGLDVVQWNKEEGSVPQIAWETIVASLSTILTNQRKEQFATKLNIEGDFANPKIGIMEAIKFVLVNAYIEALKPDLDNTINIKNATQSREKKPFLEKVFGKKDKE